MMKEHIELIKKKVKEAKQIVIISHISPDGDAVGSSLGLYHFLKNHCSNTQVVLPNAFPSFLNWLPNSDEIVLFEKNQVKAKQVIKDADIIFCLDFNETSRTAFVKDDLDQSKAFKILIDHHIGNPTWQDINLSTVGASSTCELVLDFLEFYNNGQDFLKADIAHCLYTGLLTDTGNFQFSATTPKVHLQAAKLIEAGVQPDLVNNHINNCYDEQRLQFFGFCVSERMKFVKNKKLAYMFVSKKDIHKYNIQIGGTEGLVNEPMKIADIDISVLFKEDEGKVKISFRSKKEIDISAFARSHFEGGGHRNAAGGVSYKNMEETEADFLNFLAEFNIH